MSILYTNYTPERQYESKSLKPNEIPECKKDLKRLFTEIKKHPYLLSRDDEHLVTYTIDECEEKQTVHIKLPEVNILAEFKDNTFERWYMTRDHITNYNEVLRNMDLAMKKTEELLSTFDKYMNKIGW